MTKNSGDGGEVLRWVRELQAGTKVEDNSRRIFLHYHQWVLAFLQRRGFDPSQATDLVQDTFFQVFREITRFREESTFEGWLFAIAANISRNEHRRREAKKRAAREIPLEAETNDEDKRSLDLPAEDPPADHTIFEKQRLEALRDAIRQLPPQMRRCLELRVYRDMEYREIATLMKLNINTVKAHLFHARQKLREILGEDFAQWWD